MSLCEGKLCQEKCFAISKAETTPLPVWALFGVVSLVTGKMNTFLSRANTIFAFTLSVMAALTFGCFLTTAFNEHKAPVTITTAKAIV